MFQRISQIAAPAPGFSTLRVEFATRPPTGWTPRMWNGQRPRASRRNSSRPRDRWRRPCFWASRRVPEDEHARHLQRYSGRPSAGGPEGGEAGPRGAARERCISVARRARALARVGVRGSELPAGAPRAARAVARRSRTGAGAQARPRIPLGVATGQEPGGAALDRDSRVLESVRARLRDLSGRVRDRREGGRRPQALAAAARGARLARDDGPAQMAPAALWPDRSAAVDDALPELCAARDEEARAHRGRGLSWRPRRLHAGARVPPGGDVQRV